MFLSLLISFPLFSTPRLGPAHFESIDSGHRSVINDKIRQVGLQTRQMRMESERILKDLQGRVEPARRSINDWRKINSSGGGLGIGTGSDRGVVGGDDGGGGGGGGRGRRAVEVWQMAEEEVIKKFVLVYYLKTILIVRVMS